MEPERIGTFPATGDDGRHYTVHVWMTFHLNDGDMFDQRKRLIPDAFAALTTNDGREVYALSEEADRFGVQGSGVVLTPEASPAAIFADFASRRDARMASPERIAR